MNDSSQGGCGGCLFVVVTFIWQVAFLLLVVFFMAWAGGDHLNYVEPFAVRIIHTLCERGGCW